MDGTAALGKQEWASEGPANEANATTRWRRHARHRHRESAEVNDLCVQVATKLVPACLLGSPVEPAWVGTKLNKAQHSPRRLNRAASKPKLRHGYPFIPQLERRTLAESDSVCSMSSE